MTADASSAGAPLLFEALVADELRAWMARRRISGARLARQMGQSQSWVSRRLTGETPLSFADAEVMVAHLDVPLPVVLAAVCAALGQPMEPGPPSLSVSADGNGSPVVSTVRGRSRPGSQTNAGNHV